MTAAWGKEMAAVLGNLPVEKSGLFVTEAAAQALPEPMFCGGPVRVSSSPPIFIHSVFLCYETLAK